MQWKIDFSSIFHPSFCWMKSTFSHIFPPSVDVIWSPTFIGSCILFYLSNLIFILVYLWVSETFSECCLQPWVCQTKVGGRLLLSAFEWQPLGTLCALMLFLNCCGFCRDALKMNEVWLDRTLNMLQIMVFTAPLFSAERLHTVLRLFKHTFSQNVQILNILCVKCRILILLHQYYNGLNNFFAFAFIHSFNSM